MKGMPGFRIFDPVRDPLDELIEDLSIQVELALVRKASEDEMNKLRDCMEEIGAANEYAVAVGKGVDLYRKINSLNCPPVSVAGATN